MTSTGWEEVWEKRRRVGKRRFILRNGVLMYGLIMFVLVTFVAIRPPQLTVGTVLSAAAICLAGGALFGWIMWTLTEWRYQKHLRSGSNVP
jgi:hypothetical protein